MTKQESKNNEGLIGGLILVLIGLIALVNQFVDLAAFAGLELLILPAIGMIFLLSGILTRSVGPMIPGGILSGIGLGIFLNENPYELTRGLDEGAVFMLSFALGWVLITILSAVFTKRSHHWPLIPAAIMGLIGGAILVGGVFESVLSFLGAIWPAALIVVGLFSLIRAFRGNGFEQKHA